MRRARPVAVVLAVLVAALTGCTSVVKGHGSVPSSASSSAATTQAPPVSSAAPPVAVTTAPGRFAEFARTPIITAIGDPVTADFCAAIGVDALAGAGAGITASVDDLQYPPGCSMTLKRSGHAVVGISVFATQGAPSTASGRTTRPIAGQVVYVYPFDAATGDCERSMVVGSVVLDVDAFADTSAKPDRALFCGGTDAMSTRLATVIGAADVPRIGIADPSLSAVNSCAVVRASNAGALPLFASARIEDQGLDASCELRPANAFAFVNFVIDAAPEPQNAHLETIGGHRVYAATSNDKAFCSFVSVQGTTSDGKHEEVSVSASASKAKQPPTGMCDQTGQLLARYLDTLGLR